MNKRSRAGILLVCCVALLAACGSTSQAHTNQMNMGQMSTSTIPAQTGTSQTNTSTIQAQTSTTNAVKVYVALTDFHITSSRMTFTAGIPYHFLVTNQGKTAHELVLMSTMMKTMKMSGMPMKSIDQMALASLMAMYPGTTQSFDYTFLLAKAGSHPELSCHLPGHYEAGMHLDLTVRN